MTPFQVSKLFAAESDLLGDFCNFLPDSIQAAARARLDKIMARSQGIRLPHTIPAHSGARAADKAARGGRSEGGLRGAVVPRGERDFLAALRSATPDDRAWAECLKLMHLFTQARRHSRGVAAPVTRRLCVRRR